ncbi:hypothetical protein NQD34_010311 [Periophthalmus magnuspinnatus]|nr:hypothetical protein NQD34_010311 [Periophthalmus magnuspinnatus]
MCFNDRAPEIILGLPFTEAIDVWSLGTMMASMLLGFNLFPQQSEFETVSHQPYHKQENI